MPANATGGEATPQVRFVERRNPTGGIPQGRWHNVTERWTREFFQNPEKHVEGLLGLDSACLADNSFLGLADELLKKQRAKWNRSGE